jgi:hypothetical protein
MRSPLYSLVFACLTSVVGCNFSLGEPLQAFFRVNLSIIQCSPDQYIYIDDMFKFIESNLSCVKGVRPILKAITFIYDFDDTYSIKQSDSGTIQIMFCIKNTSFLTEQNAWSVEFEPTLNGSILVNNDTQTDFQVNLLRAPEKNCIASKSLDVQHNRTHTFYIKFNRYPIKCRYQVAVSPVVVEANHDILSIKSAICYHHVSYKVSNDNLIDWALLERRQISSNISGYESNNQGGYYIYLAASTESSAINFVSRHDVISLVICST